MLGLCDMRGENMKKVLLTIMVIVLTASFAMADGDSVTWQLEGLELNNPTINYTWASNTAIAPNYSEYEYSYQIIRLDANLNFLGWTNVTDLLEDYAGEYMSSGGTVDGPAPVILFDKTVQHEDPTATIDMVVGFDEEGYGNVLIRTMEIGSLPLVGTPSGFKLWIDITATPLGDPIPEPISMILFGTCALPMLLRRKK